MKEWHMKIPLLNTDEAKMIYIFLKTSKIKLSKILVIYLESFEILSCIIIIINIKKIKVGLISMKN